MKKIYGQYLTKILSEKIPVSLGFGKFKARVPASEKKRSTIQFAEKIYAKKVDDKMVLFLSIIPHMRQERFMLEFGWSTKGRFPWDIPRPTLFLKKDKLYSEFSMDECMIDYGDIFRVNNPDALAHLGWDMWTCSVDTDHPNFMQIFIQEDLLPVTEELAEQRVQSAVETFIADVKREVLPYLHKRVIYYETKEK